MSSLLASFPVNPHLTPFPVQSSALVGSDTKGAIPLTRSYGARNVVSSYSSGSEYESGVSSTSSLALGSSLSSTASRFTSIFKFKSNKYNTSNDGLTMTSTSTRSYDACSQNSTAVHTPESSTSDVSYFASDEVIDIRRDCDRDAASSPAINPSLRYPYNLTEIYPAVYPHNVENLYPAADLAVLSPSVKAPVDFTGYPHNISSIYPPVYPYNLASIYPATNLIERSTISAPTVSPVRSSIITPLLVPSVDESFTTLDTVVDCAWNFMGILTCILVIGLGSLFHSIRQNMTAQSSSHHAQARGVVDMEKSARLNEELFDMIGAWMFGTGAVSCVLLLAYLSLWL